ncbi:MAG: response regulator [Desulfobacterales bacterium]|nr:response regulator [Desulfobacterales bacterium]
MTTRKVLVIDDEQPTLSMFRLFLNVYGYETLLAENGARGLELFDAEKPAIVFTDIKMPGMDGLTVLDRIKERAPGTEVIVMTGHGDMELAVEALNHEATDFINKPISRTALDAALHRAEERLNDAEAPPVPAEHRREDDLQVIEIRGAINAGAEEALMAAYKRALAGDSAEILLNFNKNASINGAGIAILIQLLSDSKKESRKVAIAGISENFKQIFEMVGVTRFARVFTTREEAKTHLLD